MKPRWKLFVELVFYGFMTLAGAWQISTLFRGEGPWWYWLGFFPLVLGINGFKDNWREL